MAKIVSSEKQKQALAEVNKDLKELALLKQMLEEIETADSFEIIYRIKGDRETRFCCPVSEKKIAEALCSFYRKKKRAVGKLTQGYEIVLEEKEQGLIRFLSDDDLLELDTETANDGADNRLDDGAAGGTVWQQ